uniref:Ycf34 n=1 Tax=Fibrocapsa japonica TaxID=94617 RepID=UPI0021155809|nr:Ycf34 [Fibrocapsa japonica]UTE95228.1 Ycf34 [Fibrocapsa japonica]
MCICINCVHIGNCFQYNQIELSHQEKNINNNPNFFPHQPIVQINTRKIDQNNNDIEIDLIECLSFIEKPGNWISYINILN